MEFDEEDREKISYLIVDILEKHKIKVSDDWYGDYSKEHDFYCFLEKFEEYLTRIENYVFDEIPDEE